jgi:biopolymer transport protein TolR
MRKQRRRNRAIADINIVPYIDVMLVLLVIFMIATPLLTQGVKVSLPKAHAAALPNPDNLPLIVSVNATGQYFLSTVANDKPLPAQQLAIRVAAELALAKQQGKQRQVFVKGDKAVSYGKVVQAMVLLQKAGVQKVGLMTRGPG